MSQGSYLTAPRVGEVEQRVVAVGSEPVGDGWVVPGSHEQVIAGVEVVADVLVQFGCLLGRSVCDPPDGHDFPEVTTRQVQCCRRECRLRELPKPDQEAATVA